MLLILFITVFSLKMATRCRFPTELFVTTLLLSLEEASTGPEVSAPLTDETATNVSGLRVQILRKKEQHSSFIVEQGLRFE